PADGADFADAFISYPRPSASSAVRSWRENLLDRRLQQISHYSLPGRIGVNVIAPGILFRAARGGKRRPELNVGHSGLLHDISNHRMAGLLVAGGLVGFK